MSNSMKTYTASSHSLRKPHMLTLVQTGKKRAYYSQRLGLLPVEMKGPTRGAEALRPGTAKGREVSRDEAVSALVRSTWGSATPGCNREQSS